MSGYPDSDEILRELEQLDAEQGDGHKAMEGEPAVDQAAGATDGGASSASETPYLDFDQYKTHYVKYKANGKEISEPLEKALQRAQMGYDYAQKTADLKANYVPKSEIEQAYVPKDKYEALNRWKQYDDYARENPQWAKFVEEQYARRDLVGNENFDPDDPQAQLLSQLQQRLDERFSQFDQRFSSVEQFMQERQAKAEDKALDDQINSVREKFSFMDFDQADGNGKSIEMNVLEHMTQTGIKNFQTAFIDLYQDQVLSQAQTRAREQAAKDRQTQAKKGIVGVSSSPTQKPQAQSGRPRSDRDAFNMALEFLEQQA